MRMKILFIIMFLMLSCSLSNADILVSNKVPIVKEALKRWFCYESYWQAATDVQGSSLPLEIIFDADKFFVWIEPLVEFKGKGFELRTAGFIMGRIKNEKGAVILREGHPIKDVTSAKIERRRHFETGDLTKDILEMPSDCTPRYDPMSSQKELMLHTVISTLKKQLGENVKFGIAKYPKEITLVIADFNIDYPYTYVLVEHNKKIYIVTLHNARDYDSDEFEKMGEYPFGEELKAPQSLYKKIRKHGIIKKIKLE